MTDTHSAEQSARDPINLLVSLDRSYLPQLQVLLTSIRVNNPGEQFSLFLLHSVLTDDDLGQIAHVCDALGCSFHPICVDNGLFQQAPVSKRYPKEMYYRLLAGHLLPQHLHRVLYLDPDILVINPLRPLWETDLRRHLFAAAAHTEKTDLINSVNRVRLNTDHDYYNSGVLLINLDAARAEIIPEELFAYVTAHSKELLLPDQDVLNALYGDRTVAVDDALWNYDARNYNNYYLRSSGICDVDWVMANTAILHFCGKAKPWKKHYAYRFGPVYRHYMQIAKRL
jgi:lipopolysaccharide biosynthesis glycosyltransferase